MTGGTGQQGGRGLVEEREDTDPRGLNSGEKRASIVAQREQDFILQGKGHGGERFQEED